jgi:hypothetical protein
LAVEQGGRFGGPTISITHNEEDGLGLVIPRSHERRKEATATAKGCNLWLDSGSMHYEVKKDVPEYGKC